MSWRSARSFWRMRKNWREFPKTAERFATAHLAGPERDSPTMIVTLDSKRRLTVPAALAPAVPGDYFDAQFDPEEDTLFFRRLATSSDWLAVLKECPVSMDDVPPRRRELPRRRKL